MAKYQYKWLCLLLTAAFAVSSCIKEDNGGGETPPDGTDVTFSIKLPGVKNPGTRALDADDEERVVTADVYVFDHATGKLVDIGYGRSITEDDTDPTVIIRNFSVTLVKANNRDVMVVTNARDIINAAFPGGVPLDGTVTKDIFRKTITMTLPDDGWNAAPGSTSYVSIPMWGERKHVNIDGSTALTGANSIKITRMTARMNVIINQGLVDAGKFEMTSVRLYNYNRNGLLVPDDDAADGTWQDATPYAKIPSLPQSAGFTDKPAILYDNIQNNGQSLKREIYLFEAEKGIAPADGNWLTNPCIVIGGKYDGSSTETFYRIDIVQKENNTAKYLHILRNNSYNITITDVKGPGKPDVDEAYNTLPVNIDTEVVAWNDHDMNEHLSDGQYQLSTNTNSLLFYDEGRPQTMKVYTDYPYGWKIEQSTLPAWLAGKITPDTDNSGTAIEITIEPGDILDIEPTVAIGDTIRYNFWITAGSMRKQIFIEHINEPELTLEIDPEMLFFQKSAGTEKSVTVTAYPADTPIIFGIVDGGGIDWSQQGGVFPTNTHGLQGSGVYEFKPPKNLTNNDRSSSISVSIAKGGKIVTKIVNIFQWATDLMFRVNHLHTLYPAKGDEYNLTVDSQTAWKVSGATDHHGMISGSIDQIEKAEGQSIYTFSLNDNNTWATRTVYYHTISDNIDFPREDIVVTQDYVRPHISANTTTVDLGSGDYADSYRDYTLKITSNAEYSLQLEAGFENVLQFAAPNPGGSSNPLTSATYDMEIQPKKYYAVTGTPAAGTRYETGFNITTQNHGTAPAATTDRITIKRQVPAFFTNPSITGVTVRQDETTYQIPRTGGTANIYAYTNAAWCAESWYDNKVQQNGHWTPPVQELQQSGVYINLPSNETWADRWITILQKYGFSEQSMYTEGGRHTIVQPGYYLTNIFVDEINNAAVGGYYTVRANGDFPDMQVRMSAYSTGLDNSYGILGAADGDGVSNRVSMPNNYSWNVRYFNIDFKHPHDNKWYPLYDESGTNATWGQEAAYDATPHILESSIAGGGQDITITFTGNFPHTGIKVLAWCEGLSIESQIDGNGKAVIKIPNNNTGTERTIHFYYYGWSEQDGWQKDDKFHIAALSQPKGNVTLSTTNRVVALNDCPNPNNSAYWTMQWHQGMGITSAYISATYPHIGVEGYTYDYAVGNGGCADYEEPGWPKGHWRLPTYWEAQEMYNLRGQIGNLQPLRYWVNREGASFKNVYFIDMNTGYDNGGLTLKDGSAAAVRCVRSQ